MTVSGTVYAFGDRNSDHVDDVEQYEHATNKWTVLQARMGVARTLTPAACFNGRIFIAGGWKKKRYSSVELCRSGREALFDRIAAFAIAW